MMNFKDFINESVVTNKGIFFLTEGIDHIEDLQPEDFIQTVRNMANMIATEKLDGSNLIFGFDSKGKFYTSREAKGNASRFYSVNDYTTRAADNGFKSAHAGLEKVAPKLKTVVSSGEAVEVEVLFGRQPNAIVYGDNYVAFLRMIPGDSGQMPDQQKVKELHKLMQGDTAEVQVPITTVSDDGTKLETNGTKINWKFTSVSFVDSHHFKQVNIESELSEFEAWSKQNPPASFKTKKAYLAATKQFMLPIKEKLLDGVVRKLKPALRNTEVNSSEDIGVEGVVMLDPKTGKQVKLVDKGIFSLINQFNYAIRNQIKGRGVSTRNYESMFKIFNASIGPQGASVYDDMLARINNVIGVPGLEKYMGITRTIKKFQSPENFVEAWKTQDIQQARGGITSAVQEGIKDVDQARQKFINEKDQYVLKLSDDKEIQYTDEVTKRTLLVFAETKKEMEEILINVQNSQSLGDIAAALYSRQLKSIS